MVVATGMYSLHTLWQQGNDAAITTDIVVVAALSILGDTTRYQVIHAEGTVAAVGHAMDYQQLDIRMFQWSHHNSKNFVRTSEGHMTVRRVFPVLL